MFHGDTTGSAPAYIAPAERLLRVNTPAERAENLQDYRAWLRSRDPGETYNFWDMSGDCLMGRYMAARGIEWSSSNYRRAYSAVLGCQIPLSRHPDRRVGFWRRLYSLFFCGSRRGQHWTVAGALAAAEAL